MLLLWKMKLWNSQREERQGWGPCFCVGDMQGPLFPRSQGTRAFWFVGMFTNETALSVLPSGVFTEVWLPRHDWWNQSLPISDWTQLLPFCASWRSGCTAQSAGSLIPCLVFRAWQTRPGNYLGTHHECPCRQKQTQSGQKGLVMNKKRNSHQENMRLFQPLSRIQGQRPNICINKIYIDTLNIFIRLYVVHLNIYI